MEVENDLNLDSIVNYFNFDNKEDEKRMMINHHMKIVKYIALIFIILDIYNYFKDYCL